MYEAPPGWDDAEPLGPEPPPRAKAKGGRGRGPKPGSAAFAPLSWVDPRTLASIDPKPREWIVSDAIPIGVTTLLYGDGGTGKTLLAQQLMCSTALGIRWLGLETLKCRSIGVFCEDDEDELHRRAHAICHMDFFQLSDLADCRWVSRVGEDNALIRFDAAGDMSLTPLWTAVRDQARDFEARLVVLDGAQDMFTGNENDRQQVRRFIQTACTRLAREIAGAVVLLAHPSRAGLTSGNLDGGSTTWSNSARSRLTLARPKDDDGEADPDMRILKRAKSNYSARDDEGLKIRWRAGAFAVDIGMTPTVRHIREGSAEKVFLALLDRILEQGRRVNMTSNNQLYAPKVFAAHPDRQGFTRADFEGAMNRLLNRGKIRLGTVKDEQRHPRQTLLPIAEAEQ